MPVLKIPHFFGVFLLYPVVIYGCVYILSESIRPPEWNLSRTCFGSQRVVCIRITCFNFAQDDWFSGGNYKKVFY